ncbi:probable UDP-sugar transporter protein SLC35A4 isoform X2 [Mya arenaria]|nr:probable UDP-sugar transporter protein SLC35A4 isoform X2 [Mya arenaria]XP_052796095.1 probable UDP-sugar transporter protein SLC35A4 isoform X2 [Mya arenaria]
MAHDLLPCQTPRLPPSHPGDSSSMWTAMLLLEVMIYGSYSTLVNLSEEDGHLPYSSASVILLIEVAKFVISFCLYFGEMQRDQFQMPKLAPAALVSYAVPAVLYAFNNNISLLMNQQMDPTTYQVLNNMKIATTALLYRFIIKRPIKRPQWVAICLLMVAGVCDSYGGYDSGSTPGSSSHIFITLPGLLMMTLYCSVSGVAAVYTEYILKKQLTMSLHVQNMLLYSYGFLLNLAAFVWQRRQTGGEVRGGLLAGFSLTTLVIIITQAFNGLIMSVVMKHGSNLTRLFIISGAMLVSTLSSVLFLGTTINAYFLLAAFIVSGAVYLYHQ